jgi:hypothetical protein
VLVLAQFQTNPNEARAPPKGRSSEEGGAYFPAQRLPSHCATQPQRATRHGGNFHIFIGDKSACAVIA